MHLVFNGIITISDAAHHEASWEGRVIGCLGCVVADSVLLHPLAHLLELLPVFVLPVKRAVTRSLALAALHYRHIFPLGSKSLSRETDGQNRWIEPLEQAWGKVGRTSTNIVFADRRDKDCGDKNAHSKLGEVIEECCVGKVVLREDAGTVAADDRLLSVRRQRYAARDLILGIHSCISTRNTAQRKRAEGVSRTRPHHGRPRCKQGSQQVRHQEDQDGYPQYQAEVEVGRLLSRRSDARDLGGSACCTSST